MFRLVPELAIDLGTANIIVFQRGKGIVLREPTVVAVKKKSGGRTKVLAVGEEARLMLGRTPEDIFAIRPLSDGVIADYTTTLKMLEYIFAKCCGHHRWLKPRVLICVPSGVTNVEKHAVEDAAKEAGARDAHTIEEPLAAAIGAGLPVSSAGGNFVVDIGGGTTDIAVISLGGIVISKSLRIGGNKLDEAIIRHIRANYNLMIGDMTAEEIKIKIGSADELPQEMTMEIRGRDLVGGMPKTVEISSEEIREAMSEQIHAIIEKICSILEVTPPELSADVMERGICLTGGGALIRGLDRLITAATSIKTRVAPDPLNCVALGTGRALEEMSAIRTFGNGSF